MLEVLEANSFLAVQDVTMGGPVGKGVVTKDTLQATVRRLCRGLALARQKRTSPSMLLGKAVGESFDLVSSFQVDLGSLFFKRTEMCESDNVI